MKEKILYGCKIGAPDYMEQVITDNQEIMQHPERIERAKVWAVQNGYDRLQVRTIDLSTPPDFVNTINTKK